jgi:hypothetical protein
VVDDEGLPRLRCRHTGRRVSPFHFGFLVKSWLPDLARFILEFEPSKAKPIPWHELVYGTGDLAPETDRIYFGSLMIYRKQWHVPASELPRRRRVPRTSMAEPVHPNGGSLRHKGLFPESDCDYFERVARWRRDRRIPAEGFVTIDHRVLPPGQRGEANLRAAEKFTRKPQYVNFRSPLFLPRIEKIFEVALRRVSVEEVYPRSECQMARHAGEAFVSEFVTELRMDGHDGAMAGTPTRSGAAHG